MTDPLDDLDDHFEGLGVYDIDGNPISFREWFAMRERDPESIRVARTEIDDVIVSTVHLGINHSYMLRDPPLIFETLVFGSDLDGEMYRYSTKEDAEEGHERVVELVRLEIAARSEHAEHREDDRDDDEDFETDREPDEGPLQNVDGIGDP